MSRRAAPLLLLLAGLAGCGEAPGAKPPSQDVQDPSAHHSPGAVWLERGNWVIEWNSYSPRQVAVDGKLTTTYAPTSGSGQHVRDADAPSKVEGGAKVPPRLGIALADLEPGIIELDVGTVTERNVLQDGLEAVAVSGTSARVFWTWRRRALRELGGVMVEVPFSTILIEGVRPGKIEIFLHWPNGLKQLVVVNVTAKTPR